MNHTIRKLALLLALGLCASAALLTACTTGDASGSDTSAETAAPADISCKITLQGADGQALSNVFLKVQKDDTEVATKMVGDTGSVEVTLPAADYTLTVESPDGTKLYYDTEAARLTPETTELTLTIWRGTSETWKFHAPSKRALDDSYAAFEVPLVGEGTTYIEFGAPDEYTYVVFNPTRGGIYSFSVPEAYEIAYHGMPLLVYDEPRVSADENGVITWPIEATSIGGDGIAQMVFRVTVPEGCEETGCLFTVTRTGDIIKTPEELATWITVEADKAALDALATFKEPAEGDKWATLTAGTLTNLDLKSADLTVVLASDGYYHLGTADGPMVFVRLTSDSPYVEDFVKMCETDHLRCYFYDDNGTFLRKEGYNSLFEAYGEVANADGVVPLNEQLAYTIQNVGRHMGWWNYEQNSDIFGDEVFPESIAWLFACAVYQ